MKTIHESPADAPLYNLAEDLIENGYAPYDYAKAVWLGDADPDKRLAGEHPWPTRTFENGETSVFSVPVHAGFSAVRGTALFVGKDPWKDVHDPHAWLVAEADLRTGKEWDHKILSADVDHARQLWLQLAPANYSNIPRWKDRHNPENGWLETPAGIAYNPPKRDQIRIEGRLTDDYYLDKAVLHNGLRNQAKFEDIVVLDSMLRFVRAVHEAHSTEEYGQLRQKALDFELGRRARAATPARELSLV